MHISPRARVVVAGASVFLAVAAVVVVNAVLLAGDPDHPGSAPVASSPADPEPSWSPARPSPDAGVHLSWAYLDSTEGDTTLGGDRDIHELDGLATPAIVQAYLTKLDDRTATFDPDAIGKLVEALHGDPDQTAWVTDQVDGRDKAIGDAVDACSLADTKLTPARATALDVARLAACLREGAIVQPAWAQWTVDKMRDNRGGIGDVRGSSPAQHLAQTNTTVGYAGRYRTGCLAIGAYWSAGIFVDYPAGLGDKYGVQQCAVIAGTAFPPDMQQVPDDESPAPATGHA